MVDEFIAVTILLFSCLISRSSKLPLVNAATVAAAIWVPVLLASSWPGVLYPSMRPDTTRFLTIGLLSLCGGALVAPMIAGWVRTPAPTERRAIDWLRVQQVHRVCVGILLVHALLQIYQALPQIQAAGGFGALFQIGDSTAGEFKSRAVRANLASRQGTFSAAGLVLGALNYFTFSGFFSIFTAALLWLRGNRWRAMAPVLIAGAFSFVSLQRTTFAMTTLLLAFSVVLFRRFLPDEALPSRKARTRSALNLGLLTGLGFLVVLIPLQLRNAGSGRTTGLQSLLQYFVASVAGLNNRFAAGVGNLPAPADVLGQRGPEPGFGAYTFTNLFGILKRFGFDLPAAPKVYDYSPSIIGGAYFDTNTATSFYDYHLDFGVAGLIFVPLLLGGLISRLQMRPSTTAAMRVPLAAVLLTTVAWSFFVNSLLRDSRYIFLIIVAAAVLARGGGMFVEHTKPRMGTSVR